MFLNKLFGKKDINFEVIDIDKIKVKWTWKQSYPREEKLTRKKQFYNDNGYCEDRIILNKNNKLLDGYTSYVIAKELGFKEVKIIRDKNYGDK